MKVSRSEYIANKELTVSAEQDSRELLNERKPIRPEEKPVVKLADPSNPSTWALV